jgi:hypothetical protein
MFSDENKGEPQMTWERWSRPAPEHTFFCHNLKFFIICVLHMRIRLVN